MFGICYHKNKFQNLLLPLCNKNSCNILKKKTTNQLNLLITHPITKIQKMCCTINIQKSSFEEPNKEVSKAIRKDVIQTIEEYESTETQSSNQ